MGETTGIDIITTGKSGIRNDTSGIDALPDLSIYNHSNQRVEVRVVFEPCIDSSRSERRPVAKLRKLVSSPDDDAAGDTGDRNSLLADVTGLNGAQGTYLCEVTVDDKSSVVQTIELFDGIADHDNILISVQNPDHVDIALGVS
jgi:hypothetical protein